MRLALALTVAACPAVALTPLPPCSPVSEANMWASSEYVLGGWDVESGVTVDTYTNRTYVRDNVYVPLQPPVPSLTDFNGARVVHCATGTFFAIRHEEPRDIATALAATEFLRDGLRTNQLVTLADLRRAVNALYDDTIELRETDQTCGCNAYFPDLQPAGQGDFAARTDVGN
jgi:hypothetical protein